MIPYMVGKLPRIQLIPPGGWSNMSPVGAIFVPFSLKTGTNLLHPLSPQSLNGSKAGVIEALLYGCSMWTLRRENYAKLHTVHHRVLLCITGAQRKRQDYWMTSYKRVLEIIRCESIETTLNMVRRFLWVGALLRMSGERLPKRIVFGNLEGAVRRGRGGKEKTWTGCAQSDIRAFGVAGAWKATVLEAVWVETVTQGGRRCMAAWKK